jgi:hypothetical protein
MLLISEKMQRTLALVLLEMEECLFIRKSFHHFHYYFLLLLKFEYWLNIFSPPPQPPLFPNVTFYLTISPVICKCIAYNDASIL